MSESGDGLTPAQILWEILKVALLVVGGLFLIIFLMRAFRVVLALGVLAILGAGVYWLLKRVFGTRQLPAPEEPRQLDTDVTLDPLQDKFRELELEEARIDAELERLSRDD
ncbi:hypothetical protein DL240_19190 [Lujinxingia litoralis]|uniref:Uncharacterized protein n=1 Tax=Lujinxingia litoralis TaxID=2211119 RepID=A0A328C0W4_9DELT|nr:hypothetical protein [Lujinxingia litoralis]RAL20033.1 hypothetical protein DL240_19190 [Lujinxingia litoralis]